MSMTVPTSDRSATPKDQANEAQGALAQALTGKAFIAEVDKHFASAVAQGGSDSLRSMLGNGKDFNHENKLLEEQGALPEGNKVAKLDDVSKTDKSAPIAAMMTQDKNPVAAQADANFEKKVNS